MKDTAMSRRYFLSSTVLVALASGISSSPVFGSGNHSVSSLWDIARRKKEVLKLSVWFLAQDVERLLSKPDSLNKAISWCKAQGATKVYFEAYGRGLYVNRNVLINAKQKFLRAGLEVQGGLQTVNGPDSFDSPHCFTRKSEQEELQKIFEYAASLFDEIIIDDWFFTNCTDQESNKARGNKSWAEYNSDVMAKMSQERVMAPAHKINPKVKVILKFPQWNEGFQSRGYDVVREPNIFDGIWAGTEAREFDENSSAGYEASYNAYFNMRWLATFGSLGGGWFDPGGERTKVNTYIEQARHTVLGEAKEMILCWYTDTFPMDKFDALRKELPGLIKLADIVRGKTVKGVHLLKPGNSEGFEDEYVNSFIGSLGLPFVPASTVNEQAASAFFSAHALKDPDFVKKLNGMAAKGTPVVVTDTLAKRLNTHPELVKKLTILPLNGSSRAVLKMTRQQVKPFRDQLLQPFGMKFDAPNKVELYLFGDHTIAFMNINNYPVDLTLELPKVTSVKKTLILPEENGTADISLSNKILSIRISARTLFVMDYQ
jgi:hypothetical protein